MTDVKRPTTNGSQAGHAETTGSAKGKLRFAMALKFVHLFGQSMQDLLKIAEPLGILREMVGAKSVAVFRLSPATGKIRRIAQEGPGNVIRPQSLSGLLLVTDQNAPIPHGTIVALPEPESPDTPPGQLHTAHVVLRNDQEACDLIQVVFDHAPDAEIADLLDGLAVAAADVWADRKNGVVNAMIIDQSRDHGASAGRPAAIAVLDADNPFKLSRSEFRVCSLVGKGMKPMEIAAELDLSISTVRSHLRGIYAKTDLPGQIGVLYRLKQDEAPVAYITTRPCGAEQRTALGEES